MKVQTTHTYWQSMGPFTAERRRWHECDIRAAIIDSIYLPNVATIHSNAFDSVDEFGQIDWEIEGTIGNSVRSKPKVSQDSRVTAWMVRVVVVWAGASTQGPHFHGHQGRVRCWGCQIRDGQIPIAGNHLHVTSLRQLFVQYVVVNLSPSHLFLIFWMLSKIDHLYRSNVIRIKIFQEDEKQSLLLRHLWIHQGQITSEFRWFLMVNSDSKQSKWAAGRERGEGSGVRP